MMNNTTYYAMNGDIRIRYAVEGVGAPLVLHHGFGQSLDIWYANGFVDALRRRYRLILIDSRGHGKSDKPHDAAAYAYAAQVGDVLAVLDALAVERSHYFGYSLGGWVGLGLAQSAPDRLHTLIIGGAHPYGQDLSDYREMLKLGWEASLDALEHATGQPLPALTRAAFVQNDLEALRAAYARDRPDISASVADSSLPCLLFCGARDPLLPLMERLSAELSQAKLMVLPDLNHVQVALRLADILPYVQRFLAVHEPIDVESGVMAR
jgi:pimeloyl-ACP methyl ester carboxylesterase